MNDFNIGSVLGVARAEMRLTRRLARYWIFATFAVAIAVVMWALWAIQHYFMSPFSASGGAVNPRYLASFLGFHYQSFLMLGIAFLGFEVRARDRRERISEVVDTLPVSNAEYVFGKAFGLGLMMWWPVVFAAALLALFGALSDSAVNPSSLLVFTTWLAIPAIVFTIGATFVISLGTRHRGIAGVLLGLLIIGFFFGINFVPTWFVPAIDITGGLTVGFSSDLVSRIMAWPAIPQRLGVLAGGLGLLWFASVLYPRREDAARSRAFAAAGVLVALGVVGVGLAAWTGRSYMGAHEAWNAAHAARADEPAPDVRSVRATVRLDPGDDFEVDAEIRFAAPVGESLDRATFTLNPGIEVRSATLDGGDATWTHDDGLLDVELGGALSGGREATLELELAGDPDPRFAYLDATWNPWTVTAKDGQIFLLGHEPFLNDADYVALMPSARWLPLSGSDIGRGDPQRRPVDFFDLDLTVELPEGWTAVAPGSRSIEGGTQRFTSRSPVPPFALLASRFERLSTEIDGVVTEILLHPDHVDGVRFFEDASEKIEEKLETLLRETREAGAGYPYETLSMAEVPTMLRGFGGGWRLDSVLGQPGALLLKEWGFPTAKWTRALSDPESYEEREGGYAGAKASVLEAHLRLDLTGGNPFVGASRNFMVHQTAAAGAGGVPLDWVFESLSGRVISGEASYFSMHVFDADLGQTMTEIMLKFVTEGGGALEGDFAKTMIKVAAAKRGTWERLTTTALVDLDPRDDPETALNVLAVKGDAMAESFLDEFGKDKAGELMRGILERSRGGTYGRRDIEEVGEEIGVDLTAWLSVWLDDTRLPGFLVRGGDAYRLPDTDDGSPRYQIRATISNGESVPGLLKLQVRVADDDGESSETWFEDPIRIEAGETVEVGYVTNRKPTGLAAFPYLSRNRDTFVIDLGRVDDERVREDVEPLDGIARGIEWVDDPEVWIVDDLSDGFSVIDAEDRGLRLGSDPNAEDLDEGLPRFEASGGMFGNVQVKKRWMRMTERTAYGDYRRTFALARPGPEGNSVVFASAPPRAGSYRLEVFLPSPFWLRRASGTWRVSVAGAVEETHETLEPFAAESGWIDVGVFELGEGEVTVSLDPVEDRTIVIADAIRWSPARSGATNGGASR